MRAIWYSLIDPMLVILRETRYSRRETSLVIIFYQIFKLGRWVRVLEFTSVGNRVLIPIPLHLDVSPFEILIRDDLRSLVWIRSIILLLNPRIFRHWYFLWLGIDQCYLLTFKQRNARRYWALHVFKSYSQGHPISCELQFSRVEVNDKSYDIPPSWWRSVVLNDVFVDFLPAEAHHAPFFWRRSEVIG